MSKWNAVLVSGLVFCLSTHANGQTPLIKGTTPPAVLRYVTRPDDDLILLSVHLDGNSLSDSFNAYQYPGGVLLPLGQMCQILQISVTTNPAKGTADGYVRLQNRPFHLDVTANTATLSGVHLNLTPSQIEVHRDDIYIDSKLLSKWFNLGFKLDTHASDIQVNPGEPLPMEQQFKRELLSMAAGSGHAGYIDPGFPRIPNPYQLSSGPAIDQTITLSVGPAGTQPIGHYTALIAADLEHLGLNAFVQIDSGANPNLSTFTLGEMSSEPILLGRLYAREFDIGQFYAPAVPLIWDSHLQSGILISNYPLQQSSQFDVTTFSGILLPGWDVQLFRGEAVYDYRPPTNTGRYEFKNIPIDYGLNQYRLVFNGPGGERKVENEVANIGDRSLRLGQQWYRITLDPLKDSDSPLSASAEIGLSRNLSTAIGVATAEMADGLHTYSSAGINAYTGGLRGFMNFVDDAKSGTAEQWGAQWLWQQTSVDLSEQLFQKLLSPVTQLSPNSTASKTLLQIGSLTMPKWIPLLPTDITVDHEKSRDGSELWDIRDRLSYQRQNIGVTNWIDFRSQEGAQTAISGQLLFNRWGQGPQLQGALNYSWTNELGIDELTMTLRRTYTNQRVFSYGVYQTPTSRNLGFNVGLTRNIGTYSYGYTADLSTKGGIVLSFNLSFGTVPKPDTGRWAHNAQSEATMGAVMVRVFVDKVGDGKYHQGEELLSGVGLLTNGQPFAKLTGKDGTVMLDNLPSFQPLDVQISESTLGNTLYISKRAGARIIPRPGRVPILDFPIVASGEVTGTVFEKLGTSSEAKGGVRIELVDATGKVVAKQIAAYDGFFSFLRVPPGKYTLRTALDSIYNAVGKGTSFVIPPEGAYLDGVSLTVVAKPTANGG